MDKSSWQWSYGSWIYIYVCNQCLSLIALWVQILLRLRSGVLDTILCDKVCQWLAAGQWYSLDVPVSSSNKTEHHDITEILLHVMLNTIKQTWINWEFLDLHVCLKTFFICMYFKTILAIQKVPVSSRESQNMSRH